MQDREEEGRRQVALDSALEEEDSSAYAVGSHTGASTSRHERGKVKQHSREEDSIWVSLGMGMEIAQAEMGVKLVEEAVMAARRHSIYRSWARMPGEASK